MTSVKIPYLQDKYKILSLTMERGTHLIIEQEEDHITIEDIFEFMGKLNYLIHKYQFRVLKKFIDKKEDKK